MIEAKQLIEINNRKRSELTPENEKYYSDFLIYIRLQLYISEQQSEEILMEILDHLIEGQNEGKNASSIFGDNPKEFADEIIQQIPKEQKKNIIGFISSIAFNLLGLLLIIRGMIFFIVSFFKEVDSLVYLLPSVVMFFVIVCFSLIAVWGIFTIIKGSVFKEKQRNLKDTFLCGTLAAVCTGIIIGLSYLMPNFGPSFPFTWYASVISGAIVWGVSKFLKR
ncbi:DUF1129 family protein [Neobacillus soli]|uniref:DUF1129 family protein n=1 Tax=Neobacillus soli TaxID=220688 RepID=UPI000826D374|nr:DUF1129 family protein [Neobacillus soli]